MKDDGSRKDLPVVFVCRNFGSRQCRFWLVFYRVTEHLFAKKRANPASKQRRAAEDFQVFSLRSYWRDIEFFATVLPMGWEKRRLDKEPCIRSRKARDTPNRIFQMSTVSGKTEKLSASLSYIVRNTPKISIPKAFFLFFRKFIPKIPLADANR